MPRRRPETGFDDLVRAAANVFARQGYRRTQMADIAKEMGVSPGTLYGYVESKEALFDLSVQRAFVEDGSPPPSLPVPTPARDDVIAHVRARLSSARSPALSAALHRDDPEGGDAAAELRQILTEIYGFVHANRQGLALIERAANDRPELAGVYYERGRAGLLERLERYLAARIAGGWLGSVSDVPVAARLLVESIAWFARHRHGDFDGAAFEEDVARETVVAMLTRSLVKETG
jgi:AcrR family transcriptional regulator